MDLSKVSINKLRSELWTCHILSEQRCLRRSCEWAEDLIFVLPEDGEEKLLVKLDKELGTDQNFNPEFEHARVCFEMHEYDRAAYLVRNQLDDDRSRFLHFFSMYKGAEKKRIDLMNEVSVNIHKKAMLKFNELRDSLERSMIKRKPDGWLLYVYALVLHKFRLQKNAIEVLEKAIDLTPMNWSAWYILSCIVDRESTLNNLKLPHHIFKVFFYYMVRINLDVASYEEWTLVGGAQTMNFIEKYFKESLFIKTLQAKSIGYRSVSVYKEAIDIFSHIRTVDPYRVDGMEVYSNLLYVKKFKKDLAKLAYDMERVDPFTTEANSCIANSYSARKQHTQAIVYFKRALKINPDHSTSWTLTGHEYLEMKSIDRALQAYRSAITIHKRDYRAWLGLGNTMETLMRSPNVTSPNFDACIYYYSQVGKYRPRDPRMYRALAHVYQSIDKPIPAQYCLNAFKALHDLHKVPGEEEEEEEEEELEDY